MFLANTLLELYNEIVQKKEKKAKYQEIKRIYLDLFI